MRRLVSFRKRAMREESGQTAVEYGILYAGVIVPLTFAIIFVAEMLWVWHSVVDFTRDGALYAATHCWSAGGQNVATYMRTHVPRMIDMDQFQQGPAEVVVQYFSRDPDTGSLVDFTCDGDCSVDCLPDAVTVSVQSYEFRRFVNFLGLPPVVIPDFRSSLPMESAGCDPEQGTCLP
jgi:Flp pilus assembly pilin Flp